MTATAENENQITDSTEVFTFEAGTDRAGAVRILEAIVAYIREHGFGGLSASYLQNLSVWFGPRAGVDVPRLNTDVNEAWLKPEKVAEFHARTNALYGAELRALRGRLFTYVNYGHVTLAQANDLLAAAGLPQYNPADSDLNPWTINVGSVTLEVTSPLTSEEVTRQAQEAMRVLATSLGDRHYPADFQFAVRTSARRRDTVPGGELAELLNRY